MELATAARRRRIERVRLSDLRTNQQLEMTNFQRDGTTEHLIPADVEIWEFDETTSRAERKREATTKRRSS